MKRPHRVVLSIGLALATSGLAAVVPSTPVLAGQWDGDFRGSLYSTDRWCRFSGTALTIVVTDGKVSGRHTWDPKWIRDIKGKVGENGSFSAKGNFHAKSGTEEMRLTGRFEGEKFSGKFQFGRWCSGKFTLVRIGAPKKPGAPDRDQARAVLDRADRLVAEGRFNEAFRSYESIGSQAAGPSNIPISNDAIGEALLKMAHLYEQGVLTLGHDYVPVYSGGLRGEAARWVDVAALSEEMARFADSVRAGIKAMSAGTMISKAALVAEEEAANTVDGRWTGQIKARFTGLSRCTFGDRIRIEIADGEADVFLTEQDRPTISGIKLSATKQLRHSGEAVTEILGPKRIIQFEARFLNGEYIGRYEVDKRCGGNFVVTREAETKLVEAGKLTAGGVAQLLRTGDQKLLEGDVSGAAADYARGAKAGAELPSGKSASADLVVGEVLSKHAVMLEHGLGGPRDPARAAALREQAGRWTDLDILADTLAAFTVVAQAKAGTPTLTAAAAAPAEPPLPDPAPEPEPSPAVAPAEPPAAIEMMELAGRRALQEDLALLGHYAGAIDGIVGPGTERAISAWQQGTGHTPDGRLTMRQWAELQLAARTERQSAARPAATGTDPVTSDPGALDVAFWDAIKDSRRPDDYQAYLEAFPDGRFAAQAKQRVGEYQIAAAPAAAPRSKPDLDVDFGRYHALVIGNDAYAEVTPLNTAVHDARAVAEILERNYGFAVTLLTDATRYQALSALSALRKQLTEQDNLLVYYAGHGVLDEEAELGYWLPVDAEQDNSANWIANHDITANIRAIKAKHVLVVADSCYSGTLMRAARTNVEADATGRIATIKRMAGKRSRTVLTSGGLEPVADSGPSGHSVFADAFLKQLRTNDGVLDGQSLFNGLRREVILEADQTPAYADMRRAGHGGGDFLFVRRN